jgi:hypothetical protein
MSFNAIIEAYNGPNDRAAMQAIIEIVNAGLNNELFLIKREHMATVGLYHVVLGADGEPLTSRRVMGGIESMISTFLSGVYLGGVINFKEGYERK